MRGPGALILLYHRVADLAADPQRLAVRPDRFDAQMQWLRRTMDVLSLADLLAARRDRRVPSRAAVITFDDGYADNLTTAAPILAARRVPACVFVTTGPLEDPGELWWDVLEQQLLEPGALPAELVLPIGGRTWRMGLGSAATWTTADAAAARTWTVDDADASPRHTAYRELCAALAPLASVDRRRTLAALAESGRHPVVRATHRTLTRDEVTTLAAVPGLDIGAHSVSHPSLGRLPAGEQQAELAGCRSTLRTVLGRDPRWFAYPFGGRRDQTWRTRRLARQAGFEAACANEAGLVGGCTHPFRLPRVLVRDWTPEVFADRLRGWTHA